MPGTLSLNDALKAGIARQLIDITTMITGFGPTGPYASQPAYDPIAQGLAQGHQLGITVGQGQAGIRAVLLGETHQVTKQGGRPVLFVAAYHALGVTSGAKVYIISRGSVPLRRRISTARNGCSSTAAIFSAPFTAPFKGENIQIRLLLGAGGDKIRQDHFIGFPHGVLAPKDGYTQGSGIGADITTPVVGQAKARSLYLTLTAATLQLLGQFYYLGDARGSHRVPLAQQATGGIDW